MALFNRRGATIACLISALITSVGPVTAATALNTYSGWTLYSEASAQKICFLAQTPTGTVPTDIQREAALMYVSAWPKDGVKAEVSIKLGFAAKKSSETLISIKGQTAATFKLFVKDDHAFVQDTTQELKLLDAMKKGSTLTVQAVSERGITVTDTYSLQGLTSALQALGNGCP
jgi:invasion protein IalB